MEPVVIKPNTKHYIPDFSKRIKQPANLSSTRDLGDAYFISLIEEALKSESVSLDEVMNTLK